MSNFQKLAVEQAVNKLWSGVYFDICQVDKIGNMIGVNPQAHPNYKFLHGLHCVHFADMPHELVQQLQDRVTECFVQHQFNPARMVQLLTDEGSDFAWTEDRYLGEPKERRLRLLGKGR